MDITEMLRMCGDSISNEAAAEITRLRVQLEELRALNVGLCERIAKQSDLLSKKAEKISEPVSSLGL